MSAFGAYGVDLAGCGIDYLVSSANKNIEGVPGFGFVSRAGPGGGAGRGSTQVLQGWFADDANAVADRPLLLVLFVDVLWLQGFARSPDSPKLGVASLFSKKS